MNEPAMTIPEQAVEAAAEVFRDAWRKPPEDGDDWTSLSRDFAYAALAAAQPLMGVERAAPPLREEIAREVAKIVDEPLGDGALSACDYMGDEAADDLRKAITRALFRTAGPEWRDISSAPKDGSEILIGGTNYKGEFFVGTSEWHDGWMLFHPDHDAHTAECHQPTHWMPLPAPPVAEPIVAEKQTEIKP